MKPFEVCPTSGGQFIRIVQFEAEYLGQNGTGKSLISEHRCITQLEVEVENRQLRGDVNILKKASGFSARELK